MRTPVVSLQPHVSVGEAAERMMKAGVHAVAIVDDAERVIGILTTSDVIQGLLHGPPRRGAGRRGTARRKPSDGGYEQAHGASIARSRRPTSIAPRCATAEVLHVEERDPRHLGKTLLYLDQRRDLPREGARTCGPVPALGPGSAGARAAAQGDTRGQARRGARDGQGARAVSARVTAAARGSPRDASPGRSPASRRVRPRRPRRRSGARCGPLPRSGSTSSRSGSCPAHSTTVSTSSSIGFSCASPKLKCRPRESMRS